MRAAVFLCRIFAESYRHTLVEHNSSTFNRQGECTLISCRDEYKRYLREDKIALNLNFSLLNWLTHDIWRYQRSLRLLEYYTNCKTGPLSKVFTKFLLLRHRGLGRKLGFSIPINTFEYGLSIAHAGTIVVNSNARVGPYCRIHVCVNIGADIKDGNLAPKLGSNCYIGPGVKIYGDIQIGDNVAMGANAVVNKSSSSNCTIAGVPAKKISDVGPIELRSVGR